MVLDELFRQHERLGEHRGKVTQVRLSRSRFNADELASIYYINLKAVKAILDTIDAHPDWDDEKVAENVDFD